MINPTQTSWVILAGGQASRMGGKDKGLIELNNTTLIQHVYQRLAQQTANISINANRNKAIYQQIAPVFSDQFENYPGPLGGMHSALIHSTTDWVGFVPCDSPVINLDLVERFCKQASDELDILVAHDGEYKQPVFCMYHKRILPHLTEFLASGERKIILLYKDLRMEFVDFSDTPDCFINLNTPQELAEFGTIN